LAFWDSWFTKQNGELSTTVPLNMGAGTATYPNASYENFASEGYGKNEIVHACIRELAVSAATPKYHITAPSTDGGTVEVESGVLFDLVANPNPHSDWYSFIERLVTFLMVSGNAYAIKERGRNDQVSALYLLRPDRVAIVPGDYGARGYIYTVSGVEYSIDVRDMCHLALPNPGGDLYGLSPLQVLSRTINLDLNMTDFAKVYFENAGVPSGLLKVKRRLTSQEEASTIRARWRSQFGGVNNFHRIAILDDDAEYQPMSNSPKDMALEGLHNLTESRICAVFGVPPILVGANVGLQRSTYSNYREARLAFHSETLEPMVARILRYFNRNLFNEYNTNETLSVDWSAMRAVLDDAAASSARITALFAGGLVTLNEAREELGYEAVSDGGIRRIPSSIFEVAEGQSATVAVEAAPVEATMFAPVEIKAPRVAPRGRALQRLLLIEREDEADALASRLRRHFRGIRNRVDGILGRHMERQTAATKDYPFSVEDMLPPIETGHLENIIRAAQEKVSKRTFKGIAESGVAGTLDWSDKLPQVRRILNTAPVRAQLIHATTKEAIKGGVKVALERGYSVEQLARGVPDDNFPGLRSILTETDVRARLIARTEVMRTQNLTSIGYFEAQGYEYVQADDVDGGKDDTFIDPGDPYGRTCAERHEQVYLVTDAQNIHDHPNGTLNWMPMPRGYRPDGEQNVEEEPEDKSDPDSSNFKVAEWQPDVVLGKGVHRAGVIEETEAAMKQTVMNMKDDLGTYIAKLYKRNPQSNPQVVRKGDKVLEGFNERTREKIQGGGIYRPAFDTIHVADDGVEWAMTHEMGHQITWSQQGEHLKAMLGNQRAKQFQEAIRVAWSDAQARDKAFKAKGIRGKYGTVSDYGMGHKSEYMAEGFKWAMHNPAKFKGVDDKLLAIMREFLVKENPISHKAVREGKFGN